MPKSLTTPRVTLSVRLAAVLVCCSSLALAESAVRVSAPGVRAYSAFSEDPHRRFDFWIGEWDVNLRILQEDLSWQDSIAARASIYSVLDGKAILELWDSQPIKGYSLRWFDPELGKWVLSLDWPSPNRSSKSSLQGNFRHGRGDFHTSFVDPQGVERRGRYSFNDITPFSLRWDDLWSTDGGKTWAKSWRMEFSRRAVDPEWPIDRARVPTWVDGSRCDAAEFRPYEVLEGSWNGDGTRLTAYRVLDGCGLIAFFEGDEHSEFWFVTFEGRNGRWEIDVLDDDRTTGLVTYASDSDWTSMAAESGELVVFEIDGDTLSYRRGDRVVTLER